MMQIRNITVFNFILTFLITASCPPTHIYAADVVDTIVAVVNDEAITKSELEESMLPFVADYKTRYGEEALEEKIDDARTDALNRLIEEKLIYQEAKRLNVKAEDVEIEERLESARTKFSSQEEFEKALNASGITIARLKKKYEEQIVMKKLVSSLIGSRVTISPTQIAAYYYAHPDEFKEPAMVRFEVMLLKPTDGRNSQQTEELALQICEKIKAGEDFSSLVKQYSQGPNVDKGGDMGFMPQDGIIKEIKEPLSNMQPGETSGLIKTNAGFNIVRLVERRPEKSQTLTEATEAVRERLFQREAELTLREFVDKLKKDAYISIK